MLIFCSSGQALKKEAFCLRRLQRCCKVKVKKEPEELALEKVECKDEKSNGNVQR